jgi:Mg2+-importing ATPase
VIVVIIGGLLPYTPLAGVLGLAPLPAGYFVFLSVVLVTYLAIVEIVKHRVMHRLLGDARSRGET